MRYSFPLYENQLVWGPNRVRSNTDWTGPITLLLFSVPSLVILLGSSPDLVWWLPLSFAIIGLLSNAFSRRRAPQRNRAERLSAYRACLGILRSNPIYRFLDRLTIAILCTSLTFILLLPTLSLSLEDWYTITFHFMCTTWGLLFVLHFFRISVCQNRQAYQIGELSCDFVPAAEMGLALRRDLFTLATRPSTSRQRQAANAILQDCVESIRRIEQGEIQIAGREGAYFDRWIRRLDEGSGLQNVRAFIRLTAFEPHEIDGRSWFESFYRSLNEAAQSGRLEIEYIFLIRTPAPEGEVKEFIARYERFARRISYLFQGDPRLPIDDGRPSIVLFDSQRIAFTHDRGDDGSLIQAIEWVSEDHYTRLCAHFARVEFISTTYFENPTSHQQR